MCNHWIGRQADVFILLPEQITGESVRNIDKISREAHSMESRESGHVFKS
jgi:hypothetical protein